MGTGSINSVSANRAIQKLTRMTEPSFNMVAAAQPGSATPAASIRHSRPLTHVRRKMGISIALIHRRVAASPRLFCSSSVVFDTSHPTRAALDNLPGIDASSCAPSCHRSFFPTCSSATTTRLISRRTFCHPRSADIAGFLQRTEHQMARWLALSSLIIVCTTSG